MYGVILVWLIPKVYQMYLVIILRLIPKRREEREVVRFPLFDGAFPSMSKHRRLVFPCAYEIVRVTTIIVTIAVRENKNYPPNFYEDHEGDRMQLASTARTPSSSIPRGAARCHPESIRFYPPVNRARPPGPPAMQCL